MDGQITVGMIPQLISISAKCKHCSYPRQTPGTTSAFHTMDDQFIHIAFNCTQTDRKGIPTTFQIQQPILIMVHIAIKFLQLLFPPPVGLLNQLSQI